MASSSNSVYTPIKPFIWLIFHTTWTEWVLLSSVKLSEMLKLVNFKLVAFKCDIQEEHSNLIWSCNEKIVEITPAFI